MAFSRISSTRPSRSRMAPIHSIHRITRINGNNMTYAYLIRTLSTSSSPFSTQPPSSSSQPPPHPFHINIPRPVADAEALAARRTTQSEPNLNDNMKGEWSGGNGDSGSGSGRDNLFSLILKNPVTLFLSFFAFSTLISAVRIYSNASKYRQEIEERESKINELTQQIESRTNRSHQLRNHVMDTIDTLIERSHTNTQQPPSSSSSISSSSRFSSAFPFRRRSTTNTSDHYALQQTLEQIKDDLMAEFERADRNAKPVTDVIHDNNPFVLTHGQQPTTAATATTSDVHPSQTPQQQYKTPRMIA